MWLNKVSIQKKTSGNCAKIESCFSKKTLTLPQTLYYSERSADDINADVSVDPIALDDLEGDTWGLEAVKDGK